MKRALLVALAVTAAIAFALPATAGAASFRGVVIAKDSARKSLVTASRNGVVRTVRARGAFSRVRVGRLVAVRAAALPDGTYAASKVRLLGKSRRVHFRGTVVAVKGNRLVLSAGRSVFSMLVRGGKTAASDGTGGLEPGDDVDCDAGFNDGSLETRHKRLKKVGHSGQLTLEGIYLATAEDGTIELAVVHKGRVFVHVPADVLAPDFQPGDEVALLVRVEEDGSFTLLKAENESSPGDDDDDDGGLDIGHEGGTFSVVGLLASLSADSVGVKVEGRDEPVRCMVPSDFDLSGFETGERVFMACAYRDGHPVLVTLKKKGTEEYVMVAGEITELTDHSVTVQGDGSPVSCTIPEGLNLSEFQVGDHVLMKCESIEGVWTLKGIQKKLPPPPPGDFVLLTGTITDLSPDSITVQGDGEPVTCAVAEAADLSDFGLGDPVGMKCSHTLDGLKLVRLQSETALYEAS